ncbi:aminodeoxychorismate lyase [Paenibacillus hodogayensis]|uniref:Aminodeoxychorismate lyase n=1 Tax=Paenibacillus hodogayensis TaxID=279208 RepID=A0ABV5W5U2_9BACL
MRIAVNDRICDDSEAVISVYDHGFLYGLGLFETFRTYGGRPFLLEEHLRRLVSGCEELGIAYKPDLPRLKALVVRLLSDNRLADGYIRLSVSAGEDMLGLPAGDYDKPNVIVYVKALPPRDEAAYREGKPIQLLRLRRNSPEGDVRFKSFHYMNNIMAKREMRRYDWTAGAEGIFLDCSGHVAEGIVSNLFWTSGQTLYTPDLATGILPGITRDWVIGLARSEGIEVREGFYGWEELIRAEEVFLTNSVQEIVPVRCAFDIAGKRYPIGEKTPGPITSRYMQAYAEAVGRL